MEIHIRFFVSKTKGWANGYTKKEGSAIRRGFFRILRGLCVAQKKLWPSTKSGSFVS